MSLPFISGVRFRKANQDSIPGPPLVHRARLTWNNATVRKLAEAIYEHRIFAELPILADALEDAGCGDGRILRHLRHRCEHTKHCWVLGRILAPSNPSEQEG